MVLLAILVSGSCSEDENPVTPPFRFQPDLESLWPHVMGKAWTYDLTDVWCREDEVFLYASLADVPPVPPHEVLYSRLQENLECDVDEGGTGTLIMEFGAEVSVTPEITAQELKSRTEYDVCCAQAPLALLPRWWRKSDDMIMAYAEGTASSDTNWTYLKADLSPGAEFTQDIQGLFGGPKLLTTKIWRHLRYTMPDGSQVNAVESFYLYDYGILQGTDENGELLGYLHAFIYGVIIYAEDVGPVYCREQHGLTGPGDQAKVFVPVLRDQRAVWTE